MGSAKSGEPWNGSKNILLKWFMGQANIQLYSSNGILSSTKIGVPSSTKIGVPAVKLYF